MKVLIHECFYQFYGGLLATWQDALKELGEDAPPEEVAQIMSQADKNGDGSIDYEEFCIM
jgi:Ca2+-binding EF-hand superfamily protein